MSRSLTESLQQDRFIVVATHREKGLVRVRSESEACTDLACHEETVVVTEDGRDGGIAALCPGDIVRVVEGAGRPQEIVVVRRVWEELSSPEF
jgi:hypothetical protein